MLLNNKSKIVAFGGLCTALSLVFLLLGATLPFGRLVFVFLASAVIGIANIARDKKTSLVIYIATSLLSLFIIPHKPIALLYCVVVGNYPIIKTYIEKISNKIYVLLIKFVVFNIYMLICYFGGIWLLGISFDNIQYSLGILWIWMLVVFYIYDYAYKIFIDRIFYAIPKFK